MKGLFMFFQLLYGIHLEHGVKHTAGDVFESNNDLVASFGSDKFRRLSEQEVKQLKASEPATKQTRVENITTKRVKVKRHKKKVKV